MNASFSISWQVSSLIVKNHMGNLKKGRKKMGTGNYLVNISLTVEHETFLGDER